MFRLEFRNGRANILVATDVAARGLGNIILPDYHSSMLIYNLLL